MITRNSDHDIDPATADEISAIWDEFDEFYEGGDRQKLHLYEDCMQFQRADNHLVKSVAVFSPGYKAVCRVCLDAWRGGDDE
jgi:hypothetical protein